MSSLNPFLRAFFKSSYPSQCTPVNQYVLLVPTTEVLLTNKDHETDSPFVDLVGTEEFLGSHVLKTPQLTTSGGKETGTIRENRGKARQFTTGNGRTVVIKESFVYSNKGFRNLNQAQLLSDSLYYDDSLEAQQWLIYYISKPLIGILEPIKITIATVPGLRNHTPGNITRFTPETSSSNGAESSSNSYAPNKKDIKTFNDLLNHFPMIARQMQPGMERLFREFNKDVAKPLPAFYQKSPSLSHSRSSSGSSHPTVNGSISSKSFRQHSRASSTVISGNSFAEDEEDHMRLTLETAVTAAIDLFQMVDKQQISLLGATTELDGPAVERLIERYIADQVGESVLFPRLCSIHQLDDMELESRVHQMINIDVAQVGIEIEGGKEGKQKLTAKLALAIEEFRKIGVASSPQQMMDTLLETQKILAGSSTSAATGKQSSMSEKPPAAMNADTLVSLLLLVVIRSQARRLQARLAYMRNFIFIDDVESGELGYALSTFEAVLQYLTTDSGGLRVASRRNKRLWQATKKGNLSEMRTILEPDDGSLSDEPDSIIGGDSDSLYGNGTGRDHPSNGEASSNSVSQIDHSAETANLSHVFPFQSHETEHEVAERPRPAKRVSLDLRSLSGASEFSFHSRTSTLNSATSAIEGDTSIEKLCQTQDPFSGDSVLMMAIEARQSEALDYLLSLYEYFPTHIVLEDYNGEGTTLLSAAVQSAHSELIGIMVDYVLSIRDVRHVKDYFARQDTMGRTLAHYLFHAPQLIPRFGTLLPWRTRDKNGQTPLLALCRSYDHARYIDMVNEALKFATEEQGDGLPLHMDNHIDAKGNTLLHAVSDPYLALRILEHCDADPNAANNKLFTPLMVASKFGRFDLVRAMFMDRRVDVLAKEYRGMTAVELAKDDDVRNRIDDMILVSNVPATDGRVTAVVRSFFVEDSTIRLIIKTASRSGEGMIAVTTCRRSVADFEHLAKWLAVEHPATWLPSIFNFRSPFQIPSKPSRAVLHDIQVRLDKFVKTMLAHSTFSTHELLWEFILVPEIVPDMMAERSLKKSEIRAERVKEEYMPLEDFRDIESFVTHARESIRGVNHATKSVLRRVNNIRNVSSDLHAAFELNIKPISSLSFLPQASVTAIARYTSALRPPASDPYAHLHTSLLSIHSTILAILSSLSRPHALISTLQNAQKNLERHRSSLRRSDRWPLGLLEETRKQAQLDAQDRIKQAVEDVRVAGCELRYTQQTVAAELAGWQDLHAKLAKRALKEFTRGIVVREKTRLEGMRRALREVRAESKEIPRSRPEDHSV